MARKPSKYSKSKSHCDNDSISEDNIANDNSKSTANDNSNSTVSDDSNNELNNSESYVDDQSCDNIHKIEKSLVEKKNWMHSGEVKASARPQNSLLNADVEFDTAIFNVPISAEQSSEIQRYINQRFKEKTFDNYEFQEAKEKIVEEVYDVEMVETNKEIIELYDELERELLRMTDYGNDGFS